MSVAAGMLDRVRRPEYTGENRCVPCTATNVVIAAVAAAVVWVSVPGTLGPALGGALLVGSLGAIYLRGYLVPGTPWFTRTYFPDWLLAAFDKHPAPPTTADGDLDVEATLVAAGALEECEDVEDLCLTDDFQAAWRERVEALRREDTSRADLAAILDVDPDALSFAEHGDAFSAHNDGVQVGQWESKAAFLADLAAASVLGSRAGAWGGLDARERGGLMSGLRLFIERCPDCDGPVAVEEEVKRSCCRSFDVVAASCSACGARLFEAELPQSS